MLADFPDADIVFVESGGDNGRHLQPRAQRVDDLSSTSPPARRSRAGHGPGITKSDLFVINKTDLAPYVGADLAVMEADTFRMRHTPQGLKPFVMTNLKTLAGLDEVVCFIETRGLLKHGS
jgi:urease accessory protein